MKTLCYFFYLSILVLCNCQFILAQIDVKPNEISLSGDISSINFSYSPGQFVGGIQLLGDDLYFGTTLSLGNKPVFYSTGASSRIQFAPNLNFFNPQPVIEMLPGGVLRLPGDNWDIVNTEGDLSIGSGDTRLKIGMANGGGGIGFARINSMGHSNSSLGLGTGGVSHIWINPAGRIGVGTSDLIAQTKLSVTTETENELMVVYNRKASNSQTRGIFGSAEGTGSGSRYGIHGLAAGNSGNRYGIYGTANVGSGSWGVYANGNFYHTGSFTSTSDEKLKKNIQPLQGALNKVMQLQPKSYEFRLDEYEYIHLAEGPQFGFIAQEVESVFPQIVKEDTHGFREINKTEADTNFEDPSAIKINIKSLNYIGLIPILTGAIQEQNIEIEELKNELATREMQILELESRLSRLELLIENQLNRSSYHLEKIDQIRLDQNQPNPFSGHTTIRYYLPESIERAQMVITDVTGRTIRSILLPEKGEGEVEITTADLPGGTYQYSIVVEGRPVITKRMILSRGK